MSGVEFTITNALAIDALLLLAFLRFRRYRLSFFGRCLRLAFEIGRLS